MMMDYYKSASLFVNRVSSFLSSFFSCQLEQSLLPASDALPTLRNIEEIWNFQGW